MGYIFSAMFILVMLAIALMPVLLLLLLVVYLTDGLDHRRKMKKIKR